MHRTVVRLALLAIVTPLLAASPATRPAAAPGAGIDAGVEKLAAQLTGSFASTAQSKADLSYFDIRLHMARIWTTRTDGIWLYVEQARADLLDQPYRQRVYRVHRREDGTLVSEVYTLPGTMPEAQARFAGAWQPAKAGVFDTLKPEELTHKTGCEMLMKEKPDGTFEGGTDGKKCPSELNGASYATSEALVTPKGLKTWDRGYGKDDKQVWGARKGPYLFDRVE